MLWADRAGRVRRSADPGTAGVLPGWSLADGPGRALSVQPPYALRDEGGRARYLADLTGRVAGWDAPLQVWHGPPALAAPGDGDGAAGDDRRPVAGIDSEAAVLVHQLQTGSRARVTVLVPVPPTPAHPAGPAAVGPRPVRTAHDATASRTALGRVDPPPATSPGHREARDHLRLGRGGGVAAAWVLTGWPAAVRPDWASPLTGLAHHVALHARPVDPTAAQRLLRRRLSALASTQLLDAKAGRLDDPGLSVAAQVAADLREGLARGATRLLHVQIVLVLAAEDLPALREQGRALRDTARALLAEVSPLPFQQQPGWAAATPGGTALRWPWRLLDAASVASTVPLPVGPPAPPPRRRRPAALSSTAQHPARSAGRRDVSADWSDPTPAEPGPVLAGVEPASGMPLLVDRWAAHNPTRLVVGTSGAGKSYAAKLELLRQRGAGIRAVVIDPEGEFGTVTTTVGGLHLQVGEQPAGLDPVGLATRPQMPASEGLSVLTSWAAALLAHPLSGIDVALLDRALAVLRADVPSRHAPPPDGVGGASMRRHHPATVTTGPSAADLLAVITDLTEHPPFVGADLPARLAPAAGGAIAALFAPNPALADPPGVVCFDLRAVPGRVRPAVMAAILAWTWAQTVGAPVAVPTLLVVDEAHLLLDDPPAAELLAQFARRARKYAVGLEVVTQRLSDFLGHPAGQAVLANAATKLLLGCEDHERSAVAAGLGLTPAEAEWLTPGRHGRGLLIGTDLRSPIRVVAGPTEHRLASAPPRR